MTQAASLGSSLTALGLWNNDSLPWREPFAAAAARLKDQIKNQPGGGDPDILAPILCRLIAQRLGDFAAGVQRYRSHEYRRPPAVRGCLWQEGAIRLLDYGGAAAEAPPVLVVPSLVNRGYILDLTPETSLLDHLARSGLHPYLLEWGAPDSGGGDSGSLESGGRPLDLAGYIMGPLSRVTRWLHGHRRQRPIIMGYCMGGVLAVPLAMMGLAERLLLLATPWDFHADPIVARRVKVLLPWITGVIERLACVPVDLVQAAFQTLDPHQVPHKFAALAGMKDPTRVKAFVALEDWLNDGVVLSAPLALDCLRDWYGHNLPHRGLWRLDGALVDPEQIACPSLVVAPTHDRIVPSRSALALAEALPNAQSLTVPVGHVGLVSSRSAHKVWKPIVNWLLQR